MLKDSIEELLHINPIYVDVIQTDLTYQYKDIVDLWFAYLSTVSPPILTSVFMEKPEEERKNLLKHLDKFKTIKAMFGAHYNISCQIGKKHLIIYYVHNENLKMFAQYNGQFVHLVSDQIINIFVEMVDYRNDRVGVIIWTKP